MTNEETRINGTYKIHKGHCGEIRVVPQEPHRLFSELRDKNVLFYLPPSSLMVPNDSGMHLACALAGIYPFSVGLTTHEDVRHAENARIILGHLGDSFDGKLEEHYGDSRLILSGEKQRRQFSKKDLDYVVKSIKAQAEALVA